MKRNRDEWKKVVTGMKEVLGVEYKTRHITSTAGLQEAIREMAFIFARENKIFDSVAMAEKHNIQAQINLLKAERDKYKKLYEDTTNANNSLINKYENQKNKSWFKKIWG